MLPYILATLYINRIYVGGHDNFTIILYMAKLSINRTYVGGQENVTLCIG